MKKKETQEESSQSYIEAEKVATARPFCPQEVQLSQLIREYYADNKQHKNLLKNNLKEVSVDAIKHSSSENFDPLTGLISYHFMTFLLEKSLQLAKKNDEVLAILYISLKGLKQASNVYGKDIESEILIYIAERLKRVVSKNNYLSRLHGGQYLAAFRLDKNSIIKMDELSQKITDIISVPININDHEIMIGVNSCIVAYPIHGNKISVLLDIAEMRIHRAKE